MSPGLILLLLISGHTGKQLGCTTREDVVRNLLWVREACEEDGEAFADVHTLQRSPLKTAGCAEAVHRVAQSCDGLHSCRPWPELRRSAPALGVRSIKVDDDEIRLQSRSESIGATSCTPPMCTWDNIASVDAAGTSCDQVCADKTGGICVSAPQPGSKIVYSIAVQLESEGALGVDPVGPAPSNNPATPVIITVGGTATLYYAESNGVGTSVDCSFKTTDRNSRRICPCRRRERVCKDADKPIAHGSGVHIPGHCSSPTLEPGSTCFPSCATGYQLQGNRTCVDGALYDTAVCEPSPCAMISAKPSHGTLGSCKFANSSGFLPSGQSCTIDCDNGFVRRGMRSCLRGHLTDTATCEPCAKERCAHGGVCIESGTACNCTAGYAGSSCTAFDNACATQKPCNSLDLGARCVQDNTETWGYRCTCSKSYTFVTVKGKDCNQHIGKFTWWEVICIVQTVSAVAPVLFIIRRFKRSLQGLQQQNLPKHKQALGLVGLCLFMWGIVDLALDIALCFTLLGCSQYVLLGCNATTLMTTTGMTWYLGYATLSAVVQNDTRDGLPARAWLLENPIAGPLIVLASSSRINSMAILRLKLCGRAIIDFPDSTDHRYFHFIRHAGLYHIW